jgi:hypothetical protein
MIPEEIGEHGVLPHGLTADLHIKTGCGLRVCRAGRRGAREQPVRAGLDIISPDQRKYRMAKNYSNSSFYFWWGYYFRPSATGMS